MTTCRLPPVLIAGLVAATLALPVAPLMAQSSSYRAASHSTQTVELNVCNPLVVLDVQGQGDSDLDFVVRNGNGDIVHVDDDGADSTSTTLRRAEGLACEPFTLEVANLGDEWNFYQVTLTTLGEEVRSGAQGEQARAITVANTSGETIYYLFWANSGVGNWGDDRLGAEVLAAGQDWDAQVADGSGACLFDFRAVTASGREIARPGVDVCALSSISFE